MPGGEPSKRVAPAEAVQRKPGGIQLLERYLQLREFLRWSMHFNAHKLSQLARRFEHAAHVLQMREQRFGIDVAFPTENLVAIDAELIEEVPRLAASFRSKFRQDRLQGVQLVRRHLEVGMKCHEARKAVHMLTVNTAPFAVQAIGAFTVQTV